MHCVRLMLFLPWSDESALSKAFTTSLESLVVVFFFVFFFFSLAYPSNLVWLDIIDPFVSLLFPTCSLVYILLLLLFGDSIWTLELVGLVERSFTGVITRLLDLNWVVGGAIAKTIVLKCAMASTWQLEPTLIVSAIRLRLSCLCIRPVSRFVETHNEKSWWFRLIIIRLC